MTNDYGNLELHTVLLSAMKDIDRICRENGLRYYLYAGTLLGAVNHRGFIPWDDDVDIVMFPEDFKKFQAVLVQNFADIYTLQTFDNTESWVSKMNKLYVRGTDVVSQHDGSMGSIFIDLSVLHSIPNNRILRFFQRKEIEVANLALSVRSGAVIPTSIVSKMTIGILGRLSKRFWGRFLDRVMTRYDNKNTEFVGIMCNTLSRNPYTGRSGYETDFTKRKWHDDYQYISFEDTKFMTISDPKAYLDHQYGLHWSEPYPEEKRVTKHDVKSYYISDEVRKRVGL